MMIRKSSGFTLIELLVVMAIISILFAIFFPTYTSVKEQGLLTQCQAKVRQVGLALQSYASDYDDYLPAYSSTPKDSWVPRIRTYAKDEKILICPKDEGKPLNAMWKTSDEKKIRVTYGLNALIAPEAKPEAEGGISEEHPGTAVNNIENPSKCITNLELTSGDKAPSEEHDYFDPVKWHGARGESEEGEGTTSAPQGGNGVPPEVSANQHGQDRAVYLFADGHVKVHAFKDTWNPDKSRNWYAPRENE